MKQSRVVLGGIWPYLTAAAVAVLVALFLPHSGALRGFDVLFGTPLADANGIRLPERGFLWLAVITALLTVAVLTTRLTVIAALNWMLSGIGAFYGIVAIWQRQARPDEGIGDDPNVGLILAVVAVWTFAICHSALIVRRPQEEIDAFEAAPRQVTVPEYQPDDRRARRSQRRRQSAQPEGSAGTQGARDSHGEDAPSNCSAEEGDGAPADGQEQQ